MVVTPPMIAPKMQREPEAVLERPGFVTAILSLIRPNHWVKNFFCLAGIFFSGRYSDPHAFPPAIFAFVAFCFASSATYVFNDLQDIELDRRHARKWSRPLASGQISKRVACILLTALALAAILVARATAPGVLACVLLYLLLTTAYSLKLKQIALLDVFCIAIGFMLRLAAGIYAVNEIPTGWIMICALFLTLFLGFSKRRSELYEMGGSTFLRQPRQRPVLAEYNLSFLDSLLNSTATMAILSYALFTTSSGKSKSLILTTPVVVYAIMRYKQLVMVENSGERPEKSVFTDSVLIISMLVWLALYFLFTHSRFQFFN